MACVQHGNCIPWGAAQQHLFQPYALVQLAMLGSGEQTGLWWAQMTTDDVESSGDQTQ